MSVKESSGLDQELNLILVFFDTYMSVRESSGLDQEVIVILNFGHLHVCTRKTMGKIMQIHIPITWNFVDFDCFWAYFRCLTTLFSREKLLANSCKYSHYMEFRRF